MVLSSVLVTRSDWPELAGESNMDWRMVVAFIESSNSTVDREGRSLVRLGKLAYKAQTKKTASNSSRQIWYNYSLQPVVTSSLRRNMFMCGYVRERKDEQNNM